MKGIVKQLAKAPASLKISRSGKSCVSKSTIFELKWRILGRVLSMLLKITLPLPVREVLAWCIDTEPEIRTRKSGRRSTPRDNDS